MIPRVLLIVYYILPGTILLEWVDVTPVRTNLIVLQSCSTDYVNVLFGCFCSVPVIGKCQYVILSDICLKRQQ